MKSLICDDAATAEKETGDWDKVLRSGSTRVLLDWAKRFKPWPDPTAEDAERLGSTEQELGAIQGATTDQRDFAKLESLVCRVVHHFTKNYVGKGRASPKEALSDACRLLRNIKAPEPDQYPKKELAVQQSKALDIFDYTGVPHHLLSWTCMHRAGPGGLRAHISWSIHLSPPSPMTLS